MNSSDFDFKDLVKASRTYRRFAGQAVPREVLLYLVDTARFAPSGNNMQVLRFALADDPQQVALLARHHGWAAALPDFNGPAEGELPGAYIGICAPQKVAQNPIRLIDCGIAAQTICLAAAQKGLGTCMIKSFDAEASGILGLDQKGYALQLLIALGQPAADEQVVLEDVGDQHGVKYWRTEGNVHHVPKRSLGDLLV